MFTKHGIDFIYRCPISTSQLCDGYGEAADHLLGYLVISNPCRFCLSVADRLKPFVSPWFTLVQLVAYRCHGLAATQGQGVLGSPWLTLGLPWFLPWIRSQSLVFSPAVGFHSRPHDCLCPRSSCERCSIEHGVPGITGGRSQASMEAEGIQTGMEGI